MAIKCTHIFQCKTLQHLPKLGFLVFGLKIYHLATLVEMHKE
jgi:hypothetical protein